MIIYVFILFTNDNSKGEYNTKKIIMKINKIYILYNSN